MSKIRLLLATICLANLAWGHDHSEEEYHHGNIGGVPLADFSLGKVKIPCVEVENLAPEVDGKFFDVILDRRGNSMNFELSFAEPENPALCQSIGNFAKFEEDFGDEGRKISVSCKQRQDRSKVSVEGKNLAAGEYSAEIASGANTASSPLKRTSDDEVEFDFDSDPGHIAEGATAIAPDFIQGTVSAKIRDAGGETVVGVYPVYCMNE